MKKSLLFLFALLPMMAWAQFDQYFTEASLRVDYVLTGNRETTTFSLKELIREPYWSGSKTNLIDNLEFGNYIVRVFEAGTDHRLFSKGYQNLYGEWVITPEALKLTKSFEESVIVPVPKVKVDIALYRKTWEGELKEGMRLTVNPDDYFIRDYDNLNLPVYDAWIGNEDVTKAVDVVILPESAFKIDLAQWMYEYVAIAMPIQKVHPEGECDPEMLKYLSDGDAGEEENTTGETDPRWDALKQLMEK